MRSHPRLLLAASALALTALVPIRLLAASAATAPNQRGGESTCIAEANQIGYPNVLLLGETTGLTLTVRALCAAPASLLHVVLVLDGSPGVTDAARRYEQETALEVVEALDLVNNPNHLVGTVVFGGPDTLSCALTSDRGRAERCVDEVLDTPTEMGDVADLGLGEAMAALAAGRRPWVGKAAEIREAIVLVTDARCVASCATADRAARSAHNQGALTITACASRQCKRACVRSLASSSRYFFDWPITRGQIGYVFIRIRGEVVEYRVVPKRVTLVGTLADGTRYVPDSAAPPPDTVSADGRTFTWVTNYLSRDGVTVTLRVQPEIPGNHPSGLAATGQLLDYWNLTKDFAFPQPWAVALGQQR